MIFLYCCIILLYFVLLTMLCFQALFSGFLNFRNFDVQEYEHYEVSFVCNNDVYIRCFLICILYCMLAISVILYVWYFWAHSMGP